MQLETARSVQKQRAAELVACGETAVGDWVAAPTLSTSRKDGNLNHRPPGDDKNWRLLLGLSLYAAGSRATRSWRLVCAL
jgi:hypothetical protein